MQIDFLEINIHVKINITGKRNIRLNIAEERVIKQENHLKKLLRMQTQQRG